jgi:hypothetical protein
MRRYQNKLAEDVDRALSESSLDVGGWLVIVGYAVLLLWLWKG